MPYYLIEKTVKFDREPSEAWDLPEVHWGPYPTAADATAAAGAVLSNHAVRPCYFGNMTESSHWQARERQRFDEGVYKRLPFETDNLHYAHYSRTNDGLIAFTKTYEDGYKDKQTTMRPGRYLELYQNLTVDQQRPLIAAFNAGRAGQDALKFATTADDIERVYRGKNYTRNNMQVRSCMGPDLHTGGWSSEQHPSRAYGDLDLAVAYTGDIDAVLARCVVWPNEKRWVRAYGNGADALIALLENAGYTQGYLAGARLKAIEDPNQRGKFLMPYVDGASYGRLDPTKSYFELRDHRSDHAPEPWRQWVITQNTSGWVQVFGTCARRGCDSYVGNSGDFCEACNSVRQHCQHCGRSYWHGETFVPVRAWLDYRSEYLTGSPACPACAAQAFSRLNDMCTRCEEQPATVLACSNAIGMHRICERCSANETNMRSVGQRRRRQRERAAQSTPTPQAATNGYDAMHVWYDTRVMAADWAQCAAAAPVGETTNE